jgi:hypothetical protein
MDVIVESSNVRGIPLVSMVSQDARHRPLIFYIPGYGGKKEDGLRFGYQLASAGFFFVSFDPLLHGERYERRLDHAHEPESGGIYPAETGLDTGVTFFTVIQWCSLDIQTLLAHFAQDPRADVSRCGVTGASMGGCAAFLAFADIPQLHAAVPMIGIPSFTQRWLDLLDETAFSKPDWAAALARVQSDTDEHTAFIREIDPSFRLEKAAPRALLIMNCDFDTDQPKLYSVHCYKELLPFYEVWPDHLQLRIYPAGHTVTPDMERDAALWFGKHLAY